MTKQQPVGDAVQYWEQCFREPQYSIQRCATQLLNVDGTVQERHMSLRPALRANAARTGSATCARVLPMFDFPLFDVTFPSSREHPMGVV
jgi:hypothetical protein